MRIQAILFDFDGTLVNTNDLILTSFDKAFSEVLGYTLPHGEIVKTFGLPLGECMERLSPDPALVPRLRAAYKEFHHSHHDEMIRPIAGVAEALAQLKAMGLKLAVVTSKKRPMLCRGLRCAGISRYIDAAAACNEAARPKPWPQPVFLACGRLNVLPENCLCVGDSYHDLQSGHAAGALTAAVSYTTLDWQELLTKGRPDYVVKELPELAAIVKRLNQS